MLNALGHKTGYDFFLLLNALGHKTGYDSAYFFVVSLSSFSMNSATINFDSHSTFKAHGINNKTLYSVWILMIELGPLYFILVVFVITTFGGCLCFWASRTVCKQENPVRLSIDSGIDLTYQNLYF